MRVATRQDAAAKPVSTRRSGRGTKYLQQPPGTALGYETRWLLCLARRSHSRTSEASGAAPRTGYILRCLSSRQQAGAL